MINNLDTNYQDLLKYVLDRGRPKQDRTGTGTLSIFGRQISHDLGGGFPLLTTKKMAWKVIKSELSWFLRGSTDIRELWEENNHIWDGDYEKSGRDDFDLGPIYGKQWRSWDGVDGWTDQISDLIVGLKENPDSRRHIVSAWNVNDLNKMTLPPCHYAFQCYVRGEYLDLMWQQRSGDLFLGVPFNIASYALLLSLLAKEVGLIPGVVTGTFGDLHLYNNHIDQAREQISRSALALPTLKVNSYNIMSGKIDVELLNYQSHPQIKAPLSN
jgi:thymidylate synthase|tara:strand:- start:4500 stop:5309 length:810 start_codon:yes stop_codon:yes gene_type:complete